MADATPQLGLFDPAALAAPTPAPKPLPPLRAPLDLHGAELLEGWTDDIEGPYRYHLTGPVHGSPGTRGLGVFVLLNPSTAAASEKVWDPTFGRVIGFARREGFRRACIVNLFAWRDTSPGALLTADDPVGPRNDATLQRFVVEADVVIVGWGVALATSYGARGRDLLGRRVAEVRELLAGVELHALALTADGTPRHPLYLRNDVPLVRWPQTP